MSGQCTFLVVRTREVINGWRTFLTTDGVHIEPVEHLDSNYWHKELGVVLRTIAERNEPPFKVKVED